jgi:ABC-2 type transport system permease protein
MEVNAIMAIAQRDLLKLLRDRARLISSLVTPLITVLVLGGGGEVAFHASFNILHYVLVGVMVQTVFTSTAAGTVWLLDDRMNDFSQEIFVSPISRYSIVFGKILGETLVALPQGLVLLVAGLVIGIPLSIGQVLGLLGVLVFASLLGGALGIVIITNFGSQRTANQIVPWVVYPQIMFSNVFFPLNVLPAGADFVSWIMPLRYPVDLARAIVLARSPDEFRQVVYLPPWINLLVMAILFTLFLVVGTFLFVRSERNR